MARYWVTIRFTLVLKQQQKLGVIRFIKNGKAVNLFGGNCWEVQWSGPLAAAWVWGNRILLPVKRDLPTGFLKTEGAPRMGEGKQLQPRSQAIVTNRTNRRVFYLF